MKMSAVGRWHYQGMLEDVGLREAAEVRVLPVTVPPYPDGHEIRLCLMSVKERHG